MADESVVLEDLAHQVLAVSPRHEAATAVLDNWQRRSRTMTETWATTTVGPRAEEWGRLIIPHPPTAPAQAQMVLAPRPVRSGVTARPVWCWPR